MIYGTYASNSIMAASKWVTKVTAAKLSSGQTFKRNVDLKIGGSVTVAVHKPAKAKSFVLSLRHRSTTVAQQSRSFGKKSVVSVTLTGPYSLAVATDTGRMSVTKVPVRAKQTTEVALASYPKAAPTLNGKVSGVTSGIAYLQPVDGAFSWYFEAKIGADGC